MGKPTKWTKFENKFHSFSFFALARALHIQSHDLHRRALFDHHASVTTPSPPEKLQTPVHNRRLSLSLLGKAPSQRVWKV
jgi:hypothetical protein